MRVIVRDRVQDLLNKGRTVDQIKAAKPSFDDDRRHSKPEWTAEQLVEAVVATLKPVPTPPAGGRTRRR